MAKLYRHQQERTFYTKVYRGAICTLQIHPEGVDYLYRQGTREGDEIDTDEMRALSENEWLFTKEEVRGMGEVDWTYDGWKSRNRATSTTQRRNTTLTTQAAPPANSTKSSTTVEVSNLLKWSRNVLVILRSERFASLQPDVEMSIQRFEDVIQSIEQFRREITTLHAQRYCQAIVSLHKSVRIISPTQLQALDGAMREARWFSINYDGFDVQAHLHELSLSIEQRLRMHENASSATRHKARPQPPETPEAQNLSKFSPETAPPTTADTRNSAPPSQVQGSHIKAPTAHAASTDGQANQSPMSRATTSITTTSERDELHETSASPNSTPLEMNSPPRSVAEKRDVPAWFIITVIVILLLFLVPRLS